MPECYEFEVSLRGTDPRLWRRFQLKKTATFQDLHEAIQDACGWGNCHLFSFSSSFAHNAKVIAESDDLEEPEAPVAFEVKLLSYFATHKKCAYTYDFGDTWEHDIKCNVAPAPAEKKFERRLIGGNGAFPPENCGGIWGYERCLRVVNKTGSKDDTVDDFLEWLDGWTPDGFSLPEAQDMFDC